MSPELSAEGSPAWARDTSQRPVSEATPKAADPATKFDLHLPELNLPELGEAEAILMDLAKVFSTSTSSSPVQAKQEFHDENAPNLEAKYRALLEQVPAVVFMAYLDRGISEAYVSPRSSSARLFARRVAGRSGSLVSAHPSGG
jgi:hypothetical protein